MPPRMVQRLARNWGSDYFFAPMEGFYFYEIYFTLYAFYNLLFFGISIIAYFLEISLAY